ncbi:MAG: hypothetical protein AAGB11_11155 [Pseudomonadota bacterium]
MALQLPTAIGTLLLVTAWSGLVLAQAPQPTDSLNLPDSVVTTESSTSQTAVTAQSIADPSAPQDEEPLATPDDGEPTADRTAEGAGSVDGPSARPDTPEAAPLRRQPSLADEMLAAQPRRAFLPMPLYRPMVLPQQEGPGVVVSEPQPVTPEENADEPTPVALNLVPDEDEAALAEATPAIPPQLLAAADEVGPKDTIGLSHYAFGAYQRGLYGTAFDVALRASADDDPSAAALIGRLYEEAKGVEQDYTKAAGWYAVAADLGSAEAQNRLGALLLIGRGVPKDPAKAAEKFESAADLGNTDAAHALALMLLKGEGRDRSYEDAFRFMRIAAQGGDFGAQYALAIMYAEGQGTPRDEAAATRWFGRAAEAGDPAAAFAYALRLLEGVGATVDAAAAAPFLGLAARSGDPRAMNAYAKVLVDGPPQIVDETEAIKWHLIARSGGLSDLYLDGFMASRDPGIVDEARRRASLFSRRLR